MMVRRWSYSTGEWLGGKPIMAPNGCTMRAPGHGWEIISVGEADFCLGCVADEAHARQHTPWFFTGSPHGAEILALGVSELRRAAA